MRTAELILWGAVVGGVAYAFYRYGQIAAGRPVSLAPGQAFGPAVPTGDAAVIPGPIVVEGLQ